MGNSPPIPITMNVLVKCKAPNFFVSDKIIVHLLYKSYSGKLYESD